MLSDSFSGTGKVVVADKLKELGEAISLLDKGLRKHFSDEEELFPGILGEPLTLAVTLEHQQIMEEMTSLMAISDRKGLEEISQERSPALIMHISQGINALHRMVQEHSSREDVVLRMVLAGLQESKREPTH